MRFIKTPWYSAYLLSIIIFLPYGSVHLSAQDCSVVSTTAKYWQYRQNFNKHFVLNDFNSSGCVGDGIGLSSDPTGCIFTKSGYGIPATSIVMQTNGGNGGGMFDRNDQENIPEWYDPLCAFGGPYPGTTWEEDADPRKFNYLEYGSETPHQMGQYWGVLATEYALLIQNKQFDAAQKTLNELFLALQAYRRLDMQAQCLVEKRYNEIQNYFEVSSDCGSVDPPAPLASKSCLCTERYIGGTNHVTFDKPCIGNCAFQPDLSGYSGFFLREDATQDQEILHDPSEERWNIDLVSSAYAMSQSPPCTTSFSQTCYLVKHQNFMSQDGIFGLMIGLTLIKKYIPASAVVTTCDGTTYNPLDMAIRISSAITNRIDDEYRNWILWPGSRECCDKRVYLTQSEGGSLKFTMHGLKKVANYMDGSGRQSNFDEYFHWQLLYGMVEKEGENILPYGNLGPLNVTLSSNENAEFWLRLKALGWDMGEESSRLRRLFHQKNLQYGTEILELINNLLYPDGDDFPADRAYFENMLCSAPCSGSCIKQENYRDGDSNWPDFPCANSPDWVGQRWEGGSVNPDTYRNRLYNGLDYMLLYNVYMLNYPTQATFYQNPDAPVGPYFGSSHILGSNSLCKGATGLYEIDPIYDVVAPVTHASVINNIKWTSSSNLFVHSDQTIETNVTLNETADPSYLEVSFTQERDIPEFVLEREFVSPFLVTNLNPTGSLVPDVACQFNLRKTIYNASDLAANRIKTEYSNCATMLHISTVNPPLEDVEYHWRVINMVTNVVSLYEGTEVSVPVTATPGSPGLFYIELEIENGICPENTGVSDFKIVSLVCNGNGYRVAVQPNPANDAISLQISKDDVTENIVNEKGIIIRRVDGFMNPRNSSIVANGQSINVSDLANGIYSVEILGLTTTEPVTANFIIQR